MASASTSQPHQSSSDAGNNKPRSRSYFQKSVCLQNWWLIIPDTDDYKKTLGVAGVPCTSQENRAERCFSSAPILKVLDFFELETVDGVCVILQGFINKDRTLESGFSSEVFNHFVIGFPPYWEEFATSCPGRGPAVECVSGVHEDGKGCIEGHQDIHDNAHGKSRHLDSDTLDMGVQDCEDTVVSNKTSTNHNESSLDIPHVHKIKAEREVLCERSPLTSAFEDAVNSPTISKCLEVSTRRMTRSIKKIDMSKDHPDEQNLKNISSNLSVGYGIGSNNAKAASCSVGMVLRIISKGKQNDQCVIDVTEDQRNKSSSQVGTFDQRKNKDADVSESRIGTTTSDLGANLFQAVCSDHLDPLSTTTTENFNFASSVIDLNEDKVLSRTSMKACRDKKRNIAAKSKSRLDVPCKEDDLNAAAAKQGNTSKEARMTRSKSKTKLTFGSSPCEMAKRQCLTSPQSAKSTSRLGVRHPTGTAVAKGSEERYGSAKILSPESFSGKRSRSGRVLLPALEFWRNQTVVYDADRQVTGVQEGTYVAQSLIDVSEDNKTFKKKGRRASKP